MDTSCLPVSIGHLGRSVSAWQLGGPARQQAGPWAGSGAMEQVTYSDVNGKTRHGTHEAGTQGPSCYLGSDALEFRIPETEIAGTRQVRSYGLRPWQ